jgi:LysM repeat protein
VLLAALLASPTPAAAAEPSAAQSACTRFYTLRRGDTLNRVARRFATTSGKLLTLNSLSTDATINTGRMLCVRASKGTVGAVTQTIIVQDGETLAAIARKYLTSVATLRKLNRVRSVKPGQTLIVPIRRVKARGV